MTTPPPFEPVAPLPLPDGTWLHESSHSALSRNVSHCGKTTLGITTSRLTMEVMDGALVLHFRAHQSTGNRVPIKRTRRSSTQK